MRIKARALNVDAEDYFNDKVLEDTDLLYTGMTELPADFWESTARAWRAGNRAVRLLQDHRPDRAETAGQRVRVYRD